MTVKMLLGKLSLVCSLLSMLAVHGNASTISPANADFETPNTPISEYGPYYVGPGSTLIGNAWTFGGMSGIAGENAFGFDVRNGTGQVGFLQSYPDLTPGSISQTLTGFADYASVTFDIESRQATGGAPVSVYLDTTYLGTYLANSRSSFNTITTASVYVGPGSHSLSFTVPVSTGSDATSFIDNVIVSTGFAVPEPSSLALLGFGGLSLAIRAFRRRQTAI